MTKKHFFCEEYDSFTKLHCCVSHGENFAYPFLLHMETSLSMLELRHATIGARSSTSGSFSYLRYSRDFEVSACINTA